MNWKLGIVISVLAMAGGACGGEGERGAQGESGPAGDSCAVEQLDDGQAQIVCDDGSSATLGGAAAESCAFGESAGGAVALECGDESVVLPEGSECQVEVTEQGAQVVCDDGTTIDLVTDSDDDAVEVESGVTRLAGDLAKGHSDGAGLESRMNGSMSAQFSADGEFLYFLDTFNKTLRRYGMNSDVVVTLVGSPGMEGSDDGVGGEVRFEGPRALAVDPDGTYAYIADGFNCAIRRVDLASLETETYAGMAEFCDAVDGPVQASRFGLIIGMTIDSAGDYLYVADRGNDAIRRIDLGTDQVETIAGSLADSGYADGNGEDALFDSPGGIALDHDEARLYVVDMGNAVIRAVDLTDPDFATTTVAGDPDSGFGDFADGVGGDAQFTTPQAIIRAQEEDTFYVVGFSNTVRRLTRDAGVYEVETIAGAPNDGGFVDGSFEEARFGVTFNGAVHPVSGDFYYLDLSNDAIRLVDFDEETVSTRIGATADVSGFVDGPGHQARFSTPRGLAATADGKHIYVADWGNNIIRHYDVAEDRVRLLAGSPGQWGFEDGLVDGARFDYPYGLALSPDEDFLYVTETGNNAIRRIEIATGQVTTIAGDPAEEDLVDGDLSEAVFGGLQDIVVSDDGDHLYVVDAGNQRVRHIDLVAEAVSTLAGGNDDEELDDPDGVGEDAQFAALGGLVLSPDGQTLYVTDGGQFMGAVHKGVRAIDVSTGEVTTVFAGNDSDFSSDGGNGDFSQAALSRPEHLAIDPTGTLLFVADGWGHNLRLVDLATQSVSTYLGVIGAAGGINAEHFSMDAALINRPTGIDYTPQGLVFTSDQGLYRVSLPEDQ